MRVRPDTVQGTYRTIITLFKGFIFTPPAFNRENGIETRAPAVILLIGDGGRGRGFMRVRSHAVLIWGNKDTFQVYF